MFIEWAKVIGMALLFIFFLAGMWAALYILDALRQAVPS